MMNPLMMLAQMAQGGMNPAAILQQMAAQNPQAAQAMQMIRGRSPQELQGIAMRMAQERGMDPQQMVQQFRQQFGLR